MKPRSLFNALFVCVSIISLTLSACGGAAAPQTIVQTVVEEPGTAQTIVVTATAGRAAQPTTVAVVPRSPSGLAFAPTQAPQATALPAGVIAVPRSAQSAPIAAGDPSYDEAHDAMFFQNYGVNPLIDTAEDHLSTFAMDVDTASYTLARRYVNDGQLPPPEAVRVEEFVNYFKYDYASPESGAFAIHLEGAPSPFGGEKYYLLRVGLQGRRISTEQRKDAVLTFVIDVSGSMGEGGRLETVKQALTMLVNELRPTDQVGIVVYTTQARQVLQSTPASKASEILTAINSLRPENTTNVEAGLKLGYQMASRAFRSDAINRVILCSDGVANVDSTDPEVILQQAAEYAGHEITLSTVGVGMGNYNDIILEQLADKGNGNYAYVDTLDEAHRVFVENLTGMLQVIAKDAKVQVEFNPAVVSRYRLIGYENRDVADADFRNDAVDAGEVGAGHNVTALYEVKFQDLAGVENPSLPALMVYVRYQDPETGQVNEIKQALARSQFASTFEATSPRFQLAAAVAEYAEILRQSYWAKGSSLENVQGLAQRVQEMLPGDSDVAEFAQLVGSAAQIAAR